jgi:hypothetical protein
MENLDKVVRIGTKRLHNGGRYATVYCRIQITDGELSICGVEGPLRSGNCLGSCGQINKGLTIEKFAPGWTLELLQQFLEVWNRWHLNHLRSGCEHQRKMGWKYEGHHGDFVQLETKVPGCLRFSYSAFLGHRCPVCGYRIGSRWLKEELPEEVIQFLQGLPETDKEPAWA